MERQLLIALDLGFIIIEKHLVLDEKLQSIIKMMSKFKLTLR